MQDYLLDMKYPIEPTSRRRSPGVVAHFDAFFATRGTVGTRSRAIRDSTSMIVSGCSASDGRCAPARPALHVSTRLLPFLPRALASADCIRPFHYCASCERAAPDAPETIDDQRRCTGCRYWTIYGGSRGSASLLPATSHQPPATSHQPPATRHQPPATSHQPPATSHQTPATSHPPPATSHHPPATSHQPPATSHQPPATSHQPLATSHQPLATLHSNPCI